MLAAAESLEADAIVGPYRLERIVGEGGMGVVWAARELASERDVALKFLRDVRKDDPVSHARFLREAQAAMTVRHPNVAPVHAIEYTDAGTPYLVMDLLDGESLRERLRSTGRLSAAECARILGPVVSAVRAAHAAGIVHRDLKPENVFLSTAGVRVLDFGIAKQLTEDEVKDTFTSTGAMLGTPAYMAPEQIFGERDIDGRVDVWALGVILYECLAGVRPTEGAIGQILKTITTGAIVPLAKKLPGAPAELAALVMQMLSQRPADRPSLERVATILARSAEGSETSSGAPPTAETLRSEGGRTGRSRSSGLVGLLAVVAAAIVGAFGVRYALRGPAEPAPSSTPTTQASTAWIEPSVTASVVASVAPQPSVAALPLASSSVIARPRSAPTLSVATSATNVPAAKPFDVVAGIHGGIGETTTIETIVSAGQAMRSCFPAPTAAELWSVDVHFSWPKGGPRAMWIKTLRNDVADTSPQATAIEACAKAKFDAANIPDAVGQDDIGGKPAYASVRVGYFPFR